VDRRVSWQFVSRSRVCFRLACQGTRPHLRRPDLNFTRFGIGLLLLTWANTLCAQNTVIAEAQPSAGSAIVNEINGKLELIQSSTDLDGTVKSLTIDAYKQALGANKAAANFQGKTADLKSKIASFESTLGQIKSELVRPASPKTVETENLELAELDREAKRQASLVETARQELARFDRDIASREQRLIELPKAIAEANQRLTELEQQINAKAPEDENPQLTEAQSSLFAGRRAAVTAELAALNTEGLWLNSSSQLLPAQRELAKRKLDELEAQLATWQQAAAREREDEVDRDIRKAKEFLEAAPAAIRPLAESNLATAHTRRAFDEELTSAIAKRKSLQKKLERLTDQYSRAEKEATGRSVISQTIGDVFRAKRIQLQTLDQTLTSPASLQQQADKVREQQYLLEEDRAKLDDLDLAVLSYPESVGPNDRSTLRSQLEKRRELLDGLKADSNNLAQELVQLEQTESSLHKLVDDYTTFIDEHVLWIRSTSPFGVAQANRTLESAQRLANLTEWSDFGQSIIRAFRRRPLLPIIAVALIGFLTAFAKRVRKRLLECGEQAESRNCRDFRWTLNAILLTVGMSVVLPAFFHLVGRWLEGVDSSDGSLPIAAGLMSAAAALFPLELWRNAARPHGLMESHFSVPSRTCEITRKNLGWFSVSIVPLVGIISAMGKLVTPGAYQSLGRVLFVIAMLLTAVFIYRMANPKHGVTVGYLARRPDSFSYKTRYLWLWLLALSPVVLLVISLLGYQFTAERLANRLVWTVAVLLGLWLLHAIALRWVVLSRRRLAIEQARARLAKASEQIDTGPGTAEAQADIESIDLTSVDQQTRRLIRAVTFVAGVIAFLSLWVDVLPALSRFDQVKAWDVQVTNLAADGSSGSLDSPDASTNGPATRLEMVSWADVVLTILILLGTLLAMRDVPGLLELLVLQHLPLDVALRFAIKTLTRYIIFVVGLIWAFNNIRVGWSQVQWLVAGVSVGLGFGLQEIFANFVSGLIILFERPLRAGDIVTIDDVTGVVKSIRLRSTIIRDWDRKDLIVPNKDFVTGRLLNWTLHDEVNRIVIPIGVAYGTDTDQAKSLLLSVANDHPLVASDPGPMATFEAFGDSSLNLILRCYISMQDMSNRLSVVDDLHTGIDVKFREAGIEIPFPQRDLHVRSTDATLSANPLGVKASKKPNPN